jgi:hypothetical protein
MSLDINQASAPVKRARTDYEKVRDNLDKQNREIEHMTKVIDQRLHDIKEKNRELEGWKNLFNTNEYKHQRDYDELIHIISDLMENIQKFKS